MSLRMMRLYPIITPNFIKGGAGAVTYTECYRTRNSGLVFLTFVTLVQC